MSLCSPSSWVSAQDLGALVSSGQEVEGISSVYSTTWTPLPLPSSLAVTLILAGAWWGHLWMGQGQFSNHLYPKPFGLCPLHNF